jgi:N-acetylmuramoyl-L-alanine amidase
MTAVAGAEPVSAGCVWRGPDHTRLVFDVSGRSSTDVHAQNPDRLVVDIDNANWRSL